MEESTKQLPSVSGAITVRDLVELRHLQAVPLAGESGLDRKVAWAHVSDAFDPWNWLDPGDLVLTSGYIVPREPNEQLTFIEMMAEAGLSGIVINEKNERRPRLSEEMFAAADRLRFPILEGGYAVGFAQYVRTVAAANVRGENQSFIQITKVHGEVMASLREDLAGTEFIDRLSRVVKSKLYVLDPDMWEPLIRGGRVPGRAWKEAYDREIRNSERAPFVMNLTVDGEAAMTMPIPTDAAACLIAFPNGDTRPQLAVLQQVAAACALEIGRVDTEVERARRESAGLLQDALHGRFEPGVVSELFRERRLLGDLRALVIDGRPAAIDRLARTWLIRGIPFLLGEIGMANVAVLRADDITLAELRERTDLERWRAGLSDPFGVTGHLGDAVRQARWALETVTPNAQGLALYGDSSPSFLPRTLAESKLTADRVLGPLIDYDREQGTELIETLRVYLECDRSPSRAAERLYIHTQTVNYRISRIQELTGRSMRSTGDVSELWFALRALALAQTA